MITKLIDGTKADLVGLPDWPDQYAVINRRGLPVASGFTPETARKNAIATLAASRKRALDDRKWAAEKRSDPAWDWASELLS